VGVPSAPAIAGQDQDLQVMDPAVYHVLLADRSLLVLYIYG
jgi:hypothetical protein